MREKYFLQCSMFVVCWTLVNANSLWDINLSGQKEPRLELSIDFDDVSARAIMEGMLEGYRMDLTKTLVGSKVRRSMDMNVFLPESFSPYNMSRLPNVNLENLGSKALCNFKYHEQWYLTVSTNILRYTSESLIEHVLSGFPVGPTQDIECSVYEDFIFYAIGNETTLQLYLLSSPYSTTLIHVQKMQTSKFYDRYFFEDDGQFYMAVGLNSVLTGASRIQIMGWVGTMMDSLITLDAPNLGSFCYLNDETYTYIIAVDTKAGYVSIWRLLLGIKVYDLIERVELPNVIQVLAFQVFGEQYFLCFQGGITRIYWLQGQHAILWQVIENIPTTGKAWTISYDFGLPTLILKLGGGLEFYQPDYEGHLKPVFTTDRLWDGETLNLKLMLMPSNNYMFLAASSLTPTKSIAFTTGELRLNAAYVDLDPVDPLLACLDTLETKLVEEDRLLGSLEEMGSTLLHESDNFQVDNLVVLSISAGNGSFESIHVLPNSNYSFNSSANLETEQDRLLDLAASLLLQSADIVYNNSDGFIEGILDCSSSGNVYVEDARFSDLQTIKLNDVDVDDWTESFWRYSIPQFIEQDLVVDKLHANKTVLIGKLGGRFETSEILHRGGMQTVTGHWDVEDLEVLGSVLIDSVNGVILDDIVTKRSDRAYHVEGDKAFNLLKTPVVELPNDGLTNGVDLSLWSESLVYPTISEPQNLTGKVVFNSSAEFQKDFNPQWFNDVFTLPEFYTSVALRSDSLIEIIGDIIYMENVKTNELWVSQTLNSVDPQSLILTTGGQTVLSKIVIDNLNVKGNLESNNVNGLDIGSEIIGFDGPILMDGQAIFKDVEVDNLELGEKAFLGKLNLTKLQTKRFFYIYHDVTINNVLQAKDLNAEVINGVNVTNLEQKYWFKSLNQTVPVNLTFANATFGTVNNTLFNGLSLEDDYYFIHRDETVEGDVTFKNNIVSLSATKFNSTVDHVRIDDLLADMVRLNEPSNITGIKTFDTLEIRGHLITYFVNGYAVEEDFVYLDRENVLSDRMQFEGGVVAGDLYVQGGIEAERVNGVDLQALAEDSVYLEGMDAIMSNLVFVNDLNVGSIEVAGALNNHNVSHIWHDGLRANSPTTVMLNDIVLNGNVALEGTTAFNFLNSKPLEFYLQKVVRRDDPYLYIKGAKTIESLIVADNATFAVYNDVDINAALAGIFTRSGDQVITGPYTFNNITTNNVNEVIEIGGVEWSNIVFADSGEYVIDSDVMFESPIHAGLLSILDDQVNGCYFNQSKAPYVSITEFDHIENLTIVGQLILMNPEANQPDVTRILNRAVMTNLPNNITGQITFEASAVADKVWIVSHEDFNVNLNDILHNSLRQSGANQVVKGPIVYDATTTNVKSLGTDELLLQLWNGVDLANFLPNVVTLDGNSVITGQKTFLSPVDIRFNMEAVQLTSGGVDFHRVIRASDPVWPAETTFSKVVIESALTVESIEGIDLDDFMQNRVILDGPQTIKTNLNVLDLALEKSTIQQINAVMLDDLVLKLSGPNQIISGTKTFTGNLRLDGDIEVRTVNTVPFKPFVDTLVLRGSNATFTVNQDFLSDVGVSEKSHVTIFNDQHLPTLLSQVRGTLSQAASEMTVLKDVDNFLANSSQTIRNAHTVLPVVFEYFDLVKTLHTSQPVFSLDAISTPGRAWVAMSSPKCDYELLTTRDGHDFRFMSKVEPPWSNLPAKRLFLFDPFNNGSIFLVGAGHTTDCPQNEGALWIAHFDSEGNLLTKDTLAPFLNVSHISVSFSPTVGVWMAILSRDLTVGNSVVQFLQYTDTGAWVQREVLALGPVATLDMAVVDTDIHVALGSSNESLSYVTSFVYAISERGQISQWQAFDFVGVNLVKFVTTPVEVYLVFGQEAPQEIFKSYPALLLRYENSVYVEFEKLPYDHLDDVTFMQIHGLTYGAFLSGSQVAIHRYEEERGLRPLHTFRMEGAVSLASFSLSSQTSIVVRTPGALQILGAVSRGSARWLN